MCESFDSIFKIENILHEEDFHKNEELNEDFTTEFQTDIATDATF